MLLTDFLRNLSFLGSYRTVGKRKKKNFKFQVALTNSVNSTRKRAHGARLVELGVISLGVTPVDLVCKNSVV